jgi:hypothetical protein
MGWMSATKSGLAMKSGLAAACEASAATAKAWKTEGLADIWVWVLDIRGSYERTAGKERDSP